jgi:hypothetical protein
VTVGVCVVVPGVAMTATEIRTLETSVDESALDDGPYAPVEPRRRSPKKAARSLTATVAGGGAKPHTVRFGAPPDGRFVADTTLTDAPVRLACTTSDGTRLDQAAATIDIR